MAGRWKVTLESGSQWTIRLRWLLVGVENRKTKIEENIKRNGYFLFLFVEFLLGHFFFLSFFFGAVSYLMNVKTTDAFFWWPKNARAIPWAFSLAQKAQRSQLVSLNRCAR